MAAQGARRTAPLTLEEYLEIEKDSSQRHEFVSGTMYATVGSSEAHNMIALNVAAFLLEATRDGLCQVFIRDMKLQVSDEVVYYPDVMVTCDPTDNHEYVKRSPTLVVEVLSPRTSSIDRREKVVAYKGVLQLSTYVILHQDEEHAIVYTRDEYGAWWEGNVSASGRIRIAGLDIEMPVNTVYNRVRFSKRRN